MGTVHQFPVPCNQPAAEPAEELARSLRRAIDAQVGADAPFEEREVAALELTNEATRLFLQSDLMANRGPSRGAGGGRWRLLPAARAWDGAVLHAVRAPRHRAVDLSGDRCAQWPDDCALELDAGLVERTTPALGFRIALGYAKDHMRSCEEDMTADHRCPPSRSTLERVAKAIGTAAKQVAPRIAPRLRRAERVPAGAVAISLGLDRTAVPMEETLPAGEAPAPRRLRRNTPYARKKPDPVTVNYRMAYVGTVSFHDAAGEAVATRRYTAAAHESPTDRVVNPLLADVRHALRQAPALAVGIIQDGAPELWNLLGAAVLAEPLVATYHEAIDRYHLTERLGEVLRSLEPRRVRSRGPFVEVEREPRSQ